ncbi:thioredoxin-like protein [Tribonema minus]|uniref:Thioredoxin-like protein n=1 Tax=Tribonema minus TaxID=303371 RepID=A0A835Z8H7_9STRA|nr:thioredoxin-like protein [Tribonema minus]
MMRRSGGWALQLASFLGLVTLCCSFVALPVGSGVQPRRAACSQLRMAQVIDLDDVDVAKGATFSELVLESDTPVLVDFYANSSLRLFVDVCRCGPCKLIEPLVKKTAEKYEGKMKAEQVVKVNTEVHKELVGQYNIYGLPLLAVFVDGQVKGVHEGAAGAAQMEKLLKGALPEMVA